MRQQTGIAAIVALAGLCASAAAQDSTSKNLGDLPGDALNPWSDHCAAYVVDLSPFMTSKGTQFGIAPLLKTTKVDSFVSPLEDQFFNNLYGSSTISSGTLSNMPYPQGSYMLWEDAPGFGVNPDPTKNDAGMMVSPMGNSSQFAAVISEFGTTSGGQNFNGMVGALVNFDPMNPNRLYVDRRMAAINTADEFAGDESQIGGGSIDAHGNLFIRGDNNGSTGTDQISNNNIFRVRVQDRDCMVPNIISASSTDATDVLMQNFFGNTDNDPKLGVPNHIPQRIAGGHGLSVGTNAFDSSPLMYVADTGSFTSSGSHLDMTGGIGSDHRGSFGTTSHDFLGNGSDYTAAIMAKDATGQTMVLNVVGMDSAGAIQGTMGFQIPSMLTDNDDGYMLSYNSGTEMQNYTGATLFRGGIGHVALGRDQMGRSMLAAVVNENGFSDDWAQQIVVCRYNPATGMEEWALAAYVDEPTALDPDSNDSKAICDADGNIIGRLTDLSDVTNFGLFGPGMSAASIDSVGNIWFLSSVELFDRGPKGEPDFDTALIRAIYNPETFSYKLEMILETGQIFAGLNSGTNFRVDFLGSAAGGGASPSTLYSSNMAEFAWNNSDVSGVSTADPITNGGLVFGTQITYDTNGDGFFVDPSSGNYVPDPEFPADESYSVALYVGYYQDAAPCPADLNGDGEVDFIDISAFLAGFSSMDPVADLNGDGEYDFIDISAFLAGLTNGCP